MDAIITCPAGETVVIGKTGLNPWYGFQCSGASVPSSAPISLGLGDLSWNDASLLVSALITACVLATCWNILGKIFHKG
jgi:hypothetical protein